MQIETGSKSNRLKSEVTEICVTVLKQALQICVSMQD